FRLPNSQKLLLGVEPRTSSLPRTRSTTELQQRCRSARPPAAKRVKGIEPSYSVWKTDALPLSYTRIRRDGGGGRREETKRDDANACTPPPDVACRAVSLSSLIPHPSSLWVCAEQDSNLRRAKPARFTVWCHWPLGHLPVRNRG